MAELVEKHGEIAKAKGVMVAEEVAYGTGTEEDKELLSKVFDVNSIHPDGSSCDDGNALTINDIYTNKICAGSLSNPFLTYDRNYLGFTEAEAANMKAYLGLSNFDLTLLPNGHTQLNQLAFWGSNYRHLLVVVRTSTGDLIGGYTGENYFGRTDSGTYTPEAGGEFVFNATKGIKQLPNIQPQSALYSYTYYSAAFGGGYDFALHSSPYVNKNSYGAGQTVNILGSGGQITFTPSKYGFYIVTPK